MKKLSLLVLGAALLSLSALAPAHAAGVKKGDMEVGLSLTYIDSDFAEVGLLNVSGGYMYTDALELRLGVLNTFGDVEGGFLQPGVDFLFGGAQLPVIPYVGGAYALSYGDLEDADSFDVHVGMKQFLTERTAIDYRLSRLEPTDTAVEGFTLIFVGVNFYL